VSWRKEAQLFYKKNYYDELGTMILPDESINRSKERSFIYIMMFTLIYGLTLLMWPFIAFAMGMSLAAPTPPEFEVAGRLMGELLMSYPIAVIAALLSGWYSYYIKRYIFPYWIMQLPLLWILAWIAVDYLGTDISKVPFLQ
jgi:hypothetical protein